MTSFDAAAQAGSANWGSMQPTWKTSYGQCWRTSYWTPAMATPDCDGDLAPKAEARPAPPPAPAAPVPVAKPPAPPKPSVQTVTLGDFFAEGSAKLTPGITAAIDRDVLPKIQALSRIDLVHVSGHTDRLGSQASNQKLSEARANAVATYLAEKGVPPSKIETLGLGKTNQVKSCPDQKDKKALVACLSPNRRVEVEVRGLPK